MRVVELAQAWTEAVNARDMDALRRVASPDVEVAGPRGVARGHEVLAQWLDRAGATFATSRLFARGSVAVLEQAGTWLSEDTGQRPSTATVAVVLREERGRIVSFARHDDLGAALAATGLSATDEVAAAR